MSRHALPGFALPVLFASLLCSLMANARGSGLEPESSFWASAGLGAGKVVSGSHAPSAQRSGFALNLDVGHRFNPHWGLGLEFGAIAPSGGCDGVSCTTASPDFAPSFSHFFAVGEYRPASSGWRLRGGAGLSSMCYSWYKRRANAFEKFIEVLLGNEPPTDYSISCRSLSALGLQLRGEAANFRASTKAGMPAFHHRAVVLMAVLSFN